MVGGFLTALPRSDGLRANPCPVEAVVEPMFRVDADRDALEARLEVLANGLCGGLAIVVWIQQNDQVEVNLLTGTFQDSMEWMAG